jgi:hypothetical protein
MAVVGTKSVLVMEIVVDALPVLNEAGVKVEILGAALSTLKLIAVPAALVAEPF